MGKITLNIPDTVLDELRTAAEKNVRTLTDEIVWRCMALNHTSMALDHTRLVQLVIKTGLEAIEHMVPDHTSMAANHTLTTPDDVQRMAPDHTSMVPDHIPSVANLGTIVGGWRSRFPKEDLIDEVTAKRWLGFAKGDADAVLDAFDKGQLKSLKGESLKRYVATVCKDEKGYRAKNQAKTAETVADKPGNTSGWVIRPPTAEELAEDEEAKRLMIAAGKWSPDDA